jgi:uncharacterized protein (TIGR00297 family)
MILSHVIIIVIVLLCIKTRKLTVPAAIVAGIVAELCYLGGGYTALMLLGAFFAMGVLATRHKKQLKGGESEQRTVGQVLANGGIAALCCAVAILNKSQIYLIMAAGSLAAATADTLSSELGMVYGRRFFNILTFKKEARGLDGVISIEGTLIGAMGALIIACLHCSAYGFGRSCWVIVLAGVTGNVVDSVLGATVERKRIVRNDGVNLLNTLTGAIVAYILI